MSSAYMSLFIPLALLPFAISIFVLSRRVAWQPALPPWRIKLWLVGMVVVTIFSSTLMFALSLNLFRGSKADFVLSAFGYWIIAGLAAIPLAAVLIAFGVGRLRWLGLVSALIAAACVFFELAAMMSGMAGI